MVRRIRARLDVAAAIRKAGGSFAYDSERKNGRTLWEDRSWWHAWLANLISRSDRIAKEASRTKTRADTAKPPG
jgi:hypothetical protein